MSEDVTRDSLRGLFERALALPREERAAMLERECGGDADLKRRVEALLAAAEDDRFLGDLTVGSHPSARRADEQPGTKIGPYKLLQLVGEGGFGSVFLAEQEKPVFRKVALKLIKLGMDTRQVVARFEQERQALALMDHPNVARVFDAGSTEIGRPYFVMEFCSGEPITTYCDKHNLSINARLDLFMQVCRAVQHAHQKGLIHRDIKPNNVLVSTQDGRPFAKIIDFGIAKATQSKLTEKTLFTELKQLIGTPQYMSPEQAEGSFDIDTRSDIYSLGVLLYELLTGVTPFDERNLRSAAYAEIQRIIREVDPPRPSTRLQQSSDTIASIAARRDIEPRKLGTLIRGELDWIVMKALEKDRQRRYDSATALATDIQRYLTNEPVNAAPPTRSYKLRKLIRRHKGAVSATAAIALALIVGAVGFAWQAHRANVQRDAAIVARNAESAARELAAQKEALAESVNEFFSDQILGRGDPGRLEQEHPVTLKETLDLAATELETKFTGDPLIRATIHESLGRAFRGRGYWKEAEHQFQESLDRRRAALGPDAPDTLRALHDLANAYRTNGEVDQALPLLRELVDARRRVLGNDNAETLSAISGLAAAQIMQRQYAEALPLLQTAYAGQLKAVGDRDIETLGTMNGVIVCYQGLNQTDKAIELAEKQLKLLKEVAGADHPDTTNALVVLGGLYEETNRLNEAIAMYKEADATERRLLGDDHPDRISTYCTLAQATVKSGDIATGLAMFEDAANICRGSKRIDRGILANTLVKYGIALTTAKQYPQAEAELLEAMPIVQASFGPQHYRTKRAVNALAHLYDVWGKPEQAATIRASTQPADPSAAKAAQ